MKLLTHKNTVRTAKARARNAMAAIAKTEGEIEALMARRADEVGVAVFAEFAASYYADYESGEKAVAGQEASFKTELTLEKREIDRLARKKARKEAKRAKKEVERALREKVGGKRRAVAEDSEDSASEEEDEDDRAFVAPERRPRKEPRADNVETPYITVTLKVLGAEGDEYAVPRHSTVLSLKQLFCEGMEGLTPANVRFVYRGQPMPDNQTLHQNQVGEGARIHVLRENIGGGDTKEQSVVLPPRPSALVQRLLDASAMDLQAVQLELDALRHEGLMDVALSESRAYRDQLRVLLPAPAEPSRCLVSIRVIDAQSGEQLLEGSFPVLLTVYQLIMAFIEGRGRPTSFQRIPADWSRPHGVRRTRQLGAYFRDGDVLAVTFEPAP